jgi:hypothetical protein
MKATLSFDLNDPDDRMAHLRCVKATDMASALLDITQIIIEIDNDDQVTEAELAGAIKMHDKVMAVLDDHGIDINQLIM